MVLSGRLQNGQSPPKIAWRRFPWISAVLFIAALLFAPFFSIYAFIVPFLIQIYRLLRYDFRINCIDIAFTIAFSQLYRLPGGVSYVVWYVFLCDLVFLFKRAKLYSRNGLLLLLVLMAYIALRSGGKWNLVFFMVCGLLLLYLVYHEFEFGDHESVLLAFVVGLLISTLYAFIFQDNGAVQSIVEQDAMISNVRFSGLFMDPNYYSTFVIMAMIALMCLNLCKRVNPIFYFCSFLLFIISGAQTGSKSFVLMLLGIVIYYCINMFTQKKYIRGIILLLMVAILTMQVVQGRIALFEMVLERFTGIKNITELTTGRNIVWADYIEVIKSDISIFLVGTGLDSPILEYGTHNIFLEIIYNFGVVGLTLLISFFLLTFKKICAYFPKEKQPMLRFLPILAVVLMYFFLQGVSSILFYLSLFVMYECYACCIKKAR